MSDYTPMAGYYDEIMLAGYYDYTAIVDDLARVETAGSVLEIGAGTGLILEQLATRRPELEITGVDLTQAMLDIAADRLRRYPHIGLRHQDVVSLELGRTFDVIFSYGGPMYFVPGDHDGDFTLISHIREEEGLRQAFERLADHSRPGTALLLGIQAPHTDYSKPIRAGLRYHQQVTPITDGFRKHYQLTRFAKPVMEQTTDYRTCSWGDTVGLLDKCGFDFYDDPGVLTPMFLTFQRR